ncbi:MAG: hypothetical protein RBR15_04375 [Sphaerochaeta sp.]|nr:hypothetical protein [Sphaerochaeta sp.]
MEQREFELGDLLSYEQPTPYIVQSTGYNEEYKIPVLTAGKTFILGYTNESTGIYDKLPVIIFDDFTTSSQYVNFRFKVKSSAMKILTPTLELVLPKFIYLKIQMLDFDHGTHKRYWIQEYSKIKVKIPSIPKQKLIISRIEELFSELDKGVETLETIKQQLTVYRQAVLKEAFAQIKIKKSISEMSCLVTSGSRGWAKYYSSNGSLFIRIGNLTRHTIDIILDDVQYVDLPEKAEGIRSRLIPNDVLVSITADLGSIGLVPEKVKEAYINQHIAMIRFKNPVQGPLMAWYLRSEEGQKDLLKNKRGGGKLGLGLDDIRNSKVPYISNNEADLILEKIESQLSLCESIQQTVDTALKQAVSIRKSILKQAFEGRVL